MDVLVVDVQTPRSGAGENRTPVHQALHVRATTIPDSLPDAGRPAGRLVTGYPMTRDSSFRAVIGLSRRQQSFPLSSPASGARLRWIGPVRHFWSRCLFAHLTNQAARANCSLAILWCAPFSESEQLGSPARPVNLTSKPVSPLVGFAWFTLPAPQASRPGRRPGQ